MKIIFFGLGSIGRRHLRLLQNHFDHEIYVFNHRNKEKNEFGVPEIHNLQEVEELRPEAAFICTPTNKHIEYALFCAENEIPFFLEKPISHNLEGIDELAKLVKNKSLPTYVAYCLRHHPVIKWLKDYVDNNKKKILHVRASCTSYLPNWRQGNHLEHYSAFNSKGGGVIFELSHEIDYLCYLFGIPKVIKSNSGRVGEVTVDADDFVDVLFKFDKTYASLHMDFYSQDNERKMVVEAKDKTIVADLIKNEIKIIESRKKSTINFNFEKDEIYLNQLNYFFKNFEHGNQKMMNDLQEALPIFDTILKTGG